MLCLYLSKKRKKINQKTKVIVTKGPLERVVVDGWQLDNDVKNITGYTWVIDMIDRSFFKVFNECSCTK